MTSAGYGQRDLAGEQAPTWYAAHVGISTLALLGAVGVGGRGKRPAQARFKTAPAFERGVEGNWAPRTATVSDWLLVSSLVVPPVGLAAGAQSERQWANAALIDVEAVALSVLANALVKRVVRRSRPFTHRRSAAGESDLGGDSVLSFYSGHASISATSATSGGMLLSSISSSLELRSGFWTAQLAIAALTAHLRVRAGLHYPSDVLVGSLVGAAIGVALPLAHNVAVSLAPEEIVGMGVGVGLGTAVGYLFPKTAAETLAQYPLIVRPSGSGGYLMEVAGTFD